MPELYTNTEVFEITLSDHFLIYKCTDTPVKQAIMKQWCFDAIKFW